MPEYRKTQGISRSETKEWGKSMQEHLLFVCMCVCVLMLVIISYVNAMSMLILVHGH